MGLDAKGRNFSAPRLTPGKTSDHLVYGSPSMLKDQERQIAVMEARARRYGFGGMRSVNSVSMGSASSISTGLSRVSYGTPTTQNNYAITAKPITAESNPNNRSTMANSMAGTAGAANKNKGVPIVVGFILFLMFGPIIIGILAAILSGIMELIDYL